MKNIVLVLLFGVASTAFGETTIHYDLSMPEPASHYFNVTIQVDDWSDSTLDIAMPAWSPGRYVIYDFARNVKQFSAQAGKHDLPAYKVDKQTWRIPTGGNANITISYQVYANTLSGTFSQLNQEHANYNGASVFMYVVGKKSVPVTLIIHPYKNWHIISGAVDHDGQAEFSFPNYDLLIDTPAEISDAPVFTFHVLGKEYRVMIHNDGDTTNFAKFLHELQKMVTTQRQTMPPIDYKEYTFLFHFGNLAHSGDGMEHLNSTQVIIVPELATPRGYELGLGIASHEFFHQWNVKRLRPKELGPWDYSKENYTTSLWIAEGLTNYYGDLMLRRARIYDDSMYLVQLEKAIKIMQNSYGRFERTVEQTSWDTWFWRRSFSEESDLDNTYFSYYTKGELLGYLLDIEIRSRTNGAKGLDDVMRGMYEKFYLNSPAETYYYKGHGYTGNDFLDMVDSISGSDFADFFRRYVSGKEELPYQAELAKAGLEFTPVVSSIPFSGISSVGKDNVVGMIDPGSPAEKAGLEKKDQLVAIDSFEVIDGNIEELLKTKTSGSSIDVTFLRRKKLFHTVVRLGDNTIDRYEVSEDPHATAQEIQLRNGWLNGK